MAALFRAAGKEQVRLQVQEDRCFPETGFLDLGSLALQPSDAEPGQDPNRAIAIAIDQGFYEWHVAAEAAVVEATHRLMGLNDPNKDEDQRSKARRALDCVSNVACRVGLVHPVLDAGSLSALPLSKPATIVVDTSAIVQGGLDFVVRFLHPMARIKVPAIAHMELLNAADNYFSLRRKKNNALGRVLHEHVLSQGGQRALLRSELETSTEIERGRLGADPLRGVVELGPDSEDKRLHLSVVQRSFVDRLIFETARQHATQSNQDHRVFLMTSDQGLSRMTIAEGMQPLFFERGHLSGIGGTVLTGTAFHPFTGHIYSIPLTSLIWELAVTFGLCRLRCEATGHYLDVCAIGADLPWKPYHTRHDLLWMRYDLSATTQPSAKIPPSTANSETVTAKIESAASKPAGRRSPVGAYRFSPPRMLHLIHALAEKERLTTTEVLRVLELEKHSQLDDYRYFLVSGGFIKTQEKGIVKTESLDSLWAAMRNRDLTSVGTALQRVPSFQSFIANVATVPPGPKPPAGGYGIAERAISTYVALAEAAGLVLSIPNERIYSTSARPSLEEFASLALETYSTLSMGTDDYILTGLWLEALSRDHGIHPVIARERLEEARLAEYIERFAEGSTPETRFVGHSVSVLQLVQGRPTIQKVSLFEGDFLLPGKSSVSLKLVKGTA